MDKEIAKRINRTLLGHGKTEAGFPKWRLVWTSEQLEKRRSMFPTFAGDILIGWVEEIREVLKYNYAPDMWALEEWVVSEGMPVDLVNAEKGGYEPRWLFHDGVFNGVEPDPALIEQIIYYRNNGSLKGHMPTEDEVNAANQARYREMIDDAIPERAHALVHGSAVFNDSTKVFTGGSNG